MAEKQNQTENKAMQQEREALAAANKVDATLAERLRKRTRRPVQFLEAYSAASRINRIDPSVVEVARYSAGAGEVVNLLDEEIDRLEKRQEETGEKLIETDEKKFKPLQRWRSQFNPKTRKSEMVKDDDPISTEDLIKRARDAG